MNSQLVGGQQSVEVTVFALGGVSRPDAWQSVVEMIGDARAANIDQQPRMTRYTRAARPPSPCRAFGLPMPNSL